MLVAKGAISLESSNQLAFARRLLELNLKEKRLVERLIDASR
jgi:hypothetical protein